MAHEGTARARESGGGAGGAQRERRLEGLAESHEEELSMLLLRCPDKLPGPVPDAGRSVGSRPPPPSRGLRAGEDKKGSRAL